jgi:tetratricopeptide (TPR) repeat protein
MNRMNTRCRRTALGAVSVAWLASVLAAMAALGGCASLPHAGLSPAGGEPAAWAAAVPDLEQAVKEKPEDVDRLGRLALAYYFADRFDDASATVARARELRPADGMAAYVEALLQEHAGAWAQADEIYRRRETYAPISNDLQQLMRARQEIVAREILHAEIRDQLRAAGGHPAGTIEPNALVIRRFQPMSAARSDSVLATGITHFLTQTFAEIDTLTVIDETRRRLLEDELALSSAEALDPAARLVARTIGAGLALAGRSGAGMPDSTEVLIQYQLDDLFLDKKSTSWRGTREMVQFQSPVRYVLDDLGREVVRIAEERLGLALSPELRQQLAQPPTESFAAFFAYSEGLLCEGRQEYGQAFERYREAARLDPEFTWAGEGAGRVAGAGDGGAALPPGGAPASSGNDDLRQEAADRAHSSIDELTSGRNEDPGVNPLLGGDRVRIVVRPR